jgi:hypothetical protein
MVKELNGLYGAGPFRAFKIKFPYKAQGTYLYFGTPTDAKEEAMKLQKKINHPYAPKITEITKSLQ